MHQRQAFPALGVGGEGPANFPKEAPKETRVMARGLPPFVRSGTIPYLTRF